MPGARRLAAANLHVTVQFLGEVGDADVEPLRGALEAACAGVERFTLRFARVGAGPPGPRPRMVWAHGVPSGDFTALCAAVAGAAAPFAPRLRPPSRALPHVTLARFAQPPRRGAFATAEAPLDAEVAVSACELVRSRLSPAGASYSSLARLPLGSS